jgi:hypothetical protein
MPPHTVSTPPMPTATKNKKNIILPGQGKDSRTKQSIPFEVYNSYSDSERLGICKNERDGTICGAYPVNVDIYCKTCASMKSKKKPKVSTCNDINGYVNVSSAVNGVSYSTPVAQQSTISSFQMPASQPITPSSFTHVTQHMPCANIPSYSAPSPTASVSSVSSVPQPTGFPVSTQMSNSFNMSPVCTNNFIPPAVETNNRGLGTVKFQPVPTNVKNIFTTTTFGLDKVLFRLCDNSYIAFATHNITCRSNNVQIVLDNNWCSNISEVLQKDIVILTGLGLQHNAEMFNSYYAPPKSSIANML